MKVWIRTPYSLSKNLGKAYNDEMMLIPDGDAVCFLDGDTAFLTPDFGTIIHEYANNNPGAVLTCWVSRLHHLATGQLFPKPPQDPLDIKQWVCTANELKDLRTVTRIESSVSGTLLVIPKSIWEQYPFPEVNQYRAGETNMLGVDNSFTNKIRQNGIPVLRMNGMLIWHNYRLLSDGKDKTHLL